MVLACQNLVGILHDKLELPVVESMTCVIGDSRRLLQRRVGCNPLARYKVFADAEVFQRPLRLSAPEFFRRNVDFAETIGFLSECRPCSVP